MNHEGLILAELQRLAGLVGECVANVQNLKTDVGEMREAVGELQARPAPASSILLRSRGRDAVLASAGGSLGVLFWGAGSKLLDLLTS